MERLSHAIEHAHRLDLRPIGVRPSGNSRTRRIESPRRCTARATLKAVLPAAPPQAIVAATAIAPAAPTGDQFVVAILAVELVLEDRTRQPVVAGSAVAQAQGLAERRGQRIISLAA
jgi:hypothetical protein